MHMADFILISTLILVISSQFFLFAYAKRVLARKEVEIEARLTSLVQQFITSPTPDTPSPLALLIDQTATVFASRLVGHVQQVLNASRGGERKVENMAALEAAEGALASINPGLTVLASLLPKRFKSSLIRNPQFTGALSSMLNKPGGSAPTSSNHGNTEE